MKFSGAMIGSDNPERLAAFYVQVLGEPGWHEGTWWGWSGKADLMLGEHSDVHGASANPQRIILGVETKDVADSFKRLVDLGAHVVAEPYQPEGAPGGVWLATLADPDGNYLQLASPWE
ncbi:MAG TPA: VOC family protein [Acidimicrobiales bacterium]|jgi:predicted enzyme related to lactoylglutathione lyase